MKIKKQRRPANLTRRVAFQIGLAVGLQRIIRITKKKRSRFGFDIITPFGNAHEPTKLGALRHMHAMARVAPRQVWEIKQVTEDPSQPALLEKPSPPAGLHKARQHRLL